MARTRVELLELADRIEAHPGPVKLTKETATLFVNLLRNCAEGNKVDNTGGIYDALEFIVESDAEGTIGRLAHFDDAVAAYDAASKRAPGHKLMARHKARIFRRTGE